MNLDYLKKLDELTELREKADEEHKPIFDAKIGYILSKANGDKETPDYVVCRRIKGSEGR